MFHYDPVSLNCIPSYSLTTTFLAETLAYLFNNSLATTVVLGDWKAAGTCPIFKKGDPEDVVNYLPMCMTSVVCKVFERILKRAILSLLSECKSVTGCQHGFLPYRSCSSYLLILEENARLMDVGNAAHVMYLDFAMAFDSVNHRFIWPV